MKTARNNKIHEFCGLRNYRLPGVTGRWNCPRSQKQYVIAPENGQKWQKSRVLSTCQLSCTEGHRPLNSFSSQKKVRYSPWKRPEMAKCTSFIDFQITVYRGSRAVEIIPVGKNRVQPMKTARNDKIHKFWRLPNYRVPGVTGIVVSSWKILYYFNFFLSIMDLPGPIHEILMLFGGFVP